jgi:hypothetical protein
MSTKLKRQEGEEAVDEQADGAGRKKSRKEDENLFRKMSRKRDEQTDLLADKDVEVGQDDELQESEQARR